MRSSSVRPFSRLGCLAVTHRASSHLHTFLVPVRRFASLLLLTMTALKIALSAPYQPTRQLAKHQRSRSDGCFVGPSALVGRFSELTAFVRFPNCRFRTLAFYPASTWSRLGMPSRSWLIAPHGGPLSWRPTNSSFPRLERNVSSTLSKLNVLHEASTLFASLGKQNPFLSPAVSSCETRTGVARRGARVLRIPSKASRGKTFPWKTEHYFLFSVDGPLPCRWRAQAFLAGIVICSVGSCLFCTRAC